MHAVQYDLPRLEKGNTKGQKKPAMEGGQATFEGRACMLDPAG
jgi:hypothetical protein